MPKVWNDVLRYDIYSIPGSIALAAVFLIRDQEYKRWFPTGTLSFTSSLQTNYTAAQVENFRRRYLSMWASFASLLHEWVKYKQHLQRILVNFSMRVVGLTMMGGMPIVLGKVLGAQEYGKYAYVFNWVVLAGAIGTFGLDVLGMREVSVAWEHKDFLYLQKFVTWAVKVVFKGVAIMGAVVFVAYHIIGQSSNLPESAKFFLEWRWLFLITVAHFAIIRLFEGVNLGLNRLVMAQFPRLVFVPGGELVVVALLFLLRGHVYAKDALTVLAFFAIIGAFFSVEVFFAHIGPFHVGGAELFELVEAKEEISWFRSAWILFFAATLSLINERVGVIVAGSFLSASAAGGMDVTMQLARLLVFPIVVVNTVVGPVLARLQPLRRGENNTGTLSETQNIVSLSAKLIFIASIPLFALLWYLGGDILTWMGSAFGEAQRALKILLLGQFVNVLAGPVALLLNMSGNEKETMRGVTIGTGFNLSLSLIFVRWWGIEGIAIATMIGIVVWNVYLVWRAYQVLGVCTLAFGGKHHDI